MYLYIMGKRKKQQFDLEPLSEEEQRVLNEKKDFILDSFKRSFDKELAYSKSQVTDKEREALENDKDFQALIRYYLIAEQERLVTSLRELLDSDKEDIKLKATMALGKILYPSRFDEAEAKKAKDHEPQKIDINVNLEMAMKREEYAAQVLAILATSGLLESQSQGDSTSEDEQVYSSYSDAKTGRLSLVTKS